MPVIDRQRISDGFLTLERGVDAGRAPNLLSRNQASFAGNVTVRGGYARTRPAFVNIPLEFDRSFELISSGTLTIGKKYKVTKTGTDFDLSGVGSVDQPAVGTVFTATGAAPDWGTASGGPGTGSNNPSQLNVPVAAQTWSTDTDNATEFASGYDNWESAGGIADSQVSTEGGILDVANRDSSDGFLAGGGIKWANPNGINEITITFKATYSSGEWYVNYGQPDAVLVESNIGAARSYTVNLNGGPLIIGANSSELQVLTIDANSVTGSDVDIYGATSPTSTTGVGELSTTMFELATIDESDERIKTAFQTERFQGAYNYSHGKNSYLVTSIGGHIYKINTETGMVQDITPTNGVNSFGETIYDPNASDIEVAYFQQAEHYLIIQNGESAAIIFDGATSRRANSAGTEVPTGTVMAYGNGRLWVARGREFVAGDIVGGPTDVIEFTENTYIAEGGAFAVPLDTGDITAMRFMNQPDSSLGQGELLVHTSRAVFAVNVPTSRDSWKSLQYPTVRIVAINYGSVSDRSCALVNGDMFYRAPDGIRSFISSRREWQEYGQIPVSREIGPVLRDEKHHEIAQRTSVVLFDNRLLTTVTPQNTSQGVYFRGIAPLDFDTVGGTGEKMPPAWEGLWTGLNFLQLLTAEVNEEERCFAFHLNSGCNIQLWELTKDGVKDAGNSRIGCYIETPSYSFENPLELKQLEYGEMWVDDLRGEVDFTVRYKPNQYPAWVDWNSWTECAKAETCNPVAGSCLTLKNYKPQYRSRMRLPQPLDDCEATNNLPMRNGYEFSSRIEWVGHARIKTFRLHAYPIVEEPYGDCGTVGNCV